MTNFSSWNITLPLYNSSKVFVPAKQYENTIHGPWILKRLNVMHYCAFVYRASGKAGNRIPEKEREWEQEPEPEPEPEPETATEQEQ